MVRRAGARLGLEQVVLVGGGVVPPVLAPVLHEVGGLGGLPEGGRGNVAFGDGGGQLVRLAVPVGVPAGERVARAGGVRRPGDGVARPARLGRDVGAVGREVDAVGGDYHVVPYDDGRLAVRGHLGGAALGVGGAVVVVVVLGRGGDPGAGGRRQGLGLGDPVLARPRPHLALVHHGVGHEGGAVFDGDRHVAGALRDLARHGGLGGVGELVAAHGGAFYGVGLAVGEGLAVRGRYLVAVGVDVGDGEGVQPGLLVGAPVGRRRGSLLLLRRVGGRLAVRLLLGRVGGGRLLVRAGGRRSLLLAGRRRCRRRSSLRLVRSRRALCAGLVGERHAGRHREPGRKRERGPHGSPAPRA